MSTTIQEINPEKSHFTEQNAAKQLVNDIIAQEKADPYLKPAPEVVCVPRSQNLTLEWQSDYDKVSISDTVETNVKTDGMATLKILGLKIDLTHRMTQLKQDYVDSVFQSKTPNVLLSKWGKSKMGIIGYILQKAGMTIAQLETLKSDAVSQCVKDNISKMVQLIYTEELTFIVQKRISRKSQKIFNDQYRYLIDQMAMLDKPTHWSNKRILEEREAQCLRILRDFEPEIDTLRYQVDMMESGIMQ